MVSKLGKYITSILVLGITACFFLASPKKTLIAQSVDTLHFTANEGGAYLDAASIGFNIHDTGMDTSTINSLPSGSRAMVWVGVGTSNCSSILSSEFTSFILNNKNNPKVYGYYLTDEPVDATCVNAVKAYTKYIHDNAPGQKSFILLTDWPGTYYAYRPSVTGVDLIGLDPYPVKDHIVNNVDGNYSSTDIPHEVNDAIANGIPLINIVPVFQTFGSPTTGGYQGWGSPTVEQLNRILDQWATLVPNPQLDYSYSWGLQGGGLGEALVNRSDWRNIIAAHNIQSISVKIGDINNDNLVNIIDIGILIDNYGKSPITNSRADVNLDGVVNIIDIGILIDNFTI